MTKYTKKNTTPGRAHRARSKPIATPLPVPRPILIQPREPDPSDLALVDVEGPCLAGVEDACIAEVDDACIAEVDDACVAEVDDACVAEVDDACVADVDDACVADVDDACLTDEEPTLVDVEDPDIAEPDEGRAPNCEKVNGDELEKLLFRPRLHFVTE